MEPVNSEGRGYETSDAHIKSVAMLVMLTVGIALVGVISMWFLFGYIVERDASRDTPPSPLADTRAPRKFLGTWTGKMRAIPTV